MLVLVVWGLLVAVLFGVWVVVAVALVWGGEEGVCFTLVSRREALLV